MHTQLAASILAASSGGDPFNIPQIAGVLGDILGVALLAIGVYATFRSIGQQAHHHVMRTAAVALVGLAIAGVSVTGLTGHLSAALAHLAVHG